MRRGFDDIHVRGGKRPFVAVGERYAAVYKADIQRKMHQGIDLQGQNGGKSCSCYGGWMVASCEASGLNDVLRPSDRIGSF